jgi:hypothetical protein
MSTRVSEQLRADVNDLTATIAYVAGMDKKPTRYLCEPPPGEPEINWRSDPQQMRVRDARKLAHLSLEKQGFILHRDNDPGIDFDDDRRVRSNYYPIIERTIGELTNASAVLAFDHNVRSGSKEERLRRGVFPPAKLVHLDYTLASGPQRLRELTGRELPDGQAEYAVFVNVWRPILHAVEDDALAVCDVESLSSDDLMATDLIYADRKGEFYTVKFNPEHSWYYFPRMDTGEMLIFKCFDSRDRAFSRCVPHVAFQDPNAPPNARPRDSIEVRTIAFFK